MNIGITVTDDVKILIGDSFVNTVDKIKSTGISYEIPFNKASKRTGIQETLINIEPKGIEISLENWVVTFIKSIPTSETIIMYIEDAVKLALPEYLNQVKEFVKHHVGADVVSVDSFDAKSYNTVISFKDAGSKVRVTILKSNRGELFLNTIRKI